MIEKIKKWKFELGESVLAVNLYGDSGLINFAIGGDGVKRKDLVGWNMYSVLRMLFENNEIVVCYRWIEDEKRWQKMKTDKIKELAYEPMKQHKVI